MQIQTPILVLILNHSIRHSEASTETQITIIFYLFDSVVRPRGVHFFEATETDKMMRMNGATGPQGEEEASDDGGDKVSPPPASSGPTRTKFPETWLWIDAVTG